MDLRYHYGFKIPPSDYRLGTRSDQAHGLRDCRVGCYRARGFNAGEMTAGAMPLMATVVSREQWLGAGRETRLPP
jgi:hypothetical protein